MDSLPARTSVEKKYLWNQEAVFADASSWNAELRAIDAQLPQLGAFSGTLSQGPQVLVNFFRLKDELDSRVDRLLFWASMGATVDTNNQEAQAQNSQAGSLAGRYFAATAFAQPELLAVGKPVLDQWTHSQAELATYAHYFDDLFRRQRHVRSAEVEEVLGAAGDIFSSLYTIHTLQVDSDLKFADALDSTGKPHPVAQTTVETYLSNPDRTLRQNAWYSFCDAHLANAPSMAATLITSVKKDAFEAKVRGFGSSLEAALFGDNIPSAAYENTLATFEKNLGVWHRYFRVRKKALNVESLQHWDLWAPLTQNNPVVPYETAVGWIARAMAPLGKPYTDTLLRGCLEERWVDVYPTEGKGSGAFSTGSRLTSPFIMMSYSNDLSSMSTLTHELGHSMHSWHAWKHQPNVYSNYSIFVAEVASNFHQALTRASLFEQETDREFQIALIEEAMENFHRYFFIMPILARFEREVHARVGRGEGVTSSDLTVLMADLFAQGYGTEVEVEPQREGSTWAQFNHLYASFYVFQYATGISAAHALAGPILAGDPEAAERYLELLNCGASVYPVEALKRAGIDMTTPAAMEKGFEVLSGLVDRLETLIAARG